MAGCYGIRHLVQSVWLPAHLQKIIFSQAHDVLWLFSGIPQENDKTPTRNWFWIPLVHGLLGAIGTSVENVQVQLAHHKGGWKNSP